MSATSPSDRFAEHRARLGRTVRRYVALGDSYTAGASGRNGRWADELASSLRAADPALDYRNLARYGVPSRHVADVQLDETLALRPDLVTLICGANDVLLSVRPDISAYEATLAEIFDRLGEELPGCVLVTATTPDFSSFMPLRPRSRERVSRGMAELNDTTRELARERGVLCLDFAEHPEAAARENFAEDGFHPSLSGNRRTAAAIADALESRFGIRSGHVPEEEAS